LFCCSWGLCSSSTWPTPTVCSHATVAASVRKVKKKSRQFHVSCKQAIWDTSRKVVTYLVHIPDAASNVEWRQEKTSRLLQRHTPQKWAGRQFSRYDFFYDKTKICMEWHRHLAQYLYLGNIKITGHKGKSDKVNVFCVKKPKWKFKGRLSLWEDCNLCCSRLLIFMRQTSPTSKMKWPPPRSFIWRMKFLVTNFPNAFIDWADPIVWSPSSFIGWKGPTAWST